MTAISFQNQFGQIDLNLIKDEDVAALDAPRKVAIHRVIETVMARIAAEQRLAAARVRTRVAMAAEDEALSHVAKPPTFQEIRAAAILAYNGE